MRMIAVFGMIGLIWSSGSWLAVVDAQTNAANTNASGNAAANTGDAPAIRLTPTMARAIAKNLAPKLKRYELPDDKMGEATEKIARRIMETAHNVDRDGAQAVQRFMEEQIAAQLDGEAHTGMPKGYGKEFADRALDLLPDARDFIRNIGQDIRPMLSMKMQLKMGADWMTIKAGMDAFEQNMEKWSSGEITDFGDPFDPTNQPMPGEQPVKKDADGQSANLKSARQDAQNEVNKFDVSQWDTYVQQFKEFYALDAKQMVTVDSIVREYKQRAEQRKRDATWIGHIYRGTIWANIFRSMRNGWNHPLRQMVEDDQSQSSLWWDEMTEGLKSRLETVPTSAQRRTAEARIEAKLRDQGFILEAFNP